MWDNRLCFPLAWGFLASLATPCFLARMNGEHVAQEIPRVPCLCAGICSDPYLHVTHAMCPSKEVQGCVGSEELPAWREFL